jgi:hypothetical protein
MVDICKYMTGLGPVNSRPITGQFLAHNRDSQVVRAFYAEDLHSGAKRLVEPMMTQAAYLARVNVTYAWWAHKRQAERAAIEAGFVPLVPSRLVAPATNGHLPAVSEIDDSTLFNIIAVKGVDRVLSVAAEVERAMHS